MNKNGIYKTINGAAPDCVKLDHVLIVLKRAIFRTAFIWFFIGLFSGMLAMYFFKK